MPFQAFGAAIQNARLAVSVRVHGTKRRGASVDGRDRVVNWRGFVDVRRIGSRQSLMCDDRYFLLDALLDRQPCEETVTAV